MYSMQGIVRKSVNNVTTQFEKLGYVANSLANMNTKGYKSVSFEQMLNEEGYLTGAIRTDYKQGSIQITSNPYDVAINGTGFIPVVSPEGEVAYTRDGAFRQGKDGYLETTDGWIVGEGIQIPMNCYKFEIKSNGEVFAYDGKNTKPKKLGTIPLVRFPSQENLEQAGMNKLVPTEESGEPQLVKDHDCFCQNNLENSNTNIYASTSDMLRLNASLLASTRMMKVVDDMYNKAINIRE
ncbi:flagellar basal-body rod protein FlgG [Clostridium sp. CAG:768]|jgi:flagellar basal-body rod protein FlgG|nr:flagellar basal-body rod protein FlgG [Clostridium sp. CAG:768]